MLEQGKGCVSFPCSRLWNKGPELEIGLWSLRNPSWHPIFYKPYRMVANMCYGGPQKQTDPSFCGSFIIVIRPSSTSSFFTNFYFCRDSLASFSPRSSLPLLVPASLFEYQRRRHRSGTVSLAPKITNGIITRTVYKFLTRKSWYPWSLGSGRLPFCLPHGLLFKTPSGLLRKRNSTKAPSPLFPSLFFHLSLSYVYERNKFVIKNNEKKWRIWMEIILEIKIVNL